MGYQPIDLEQSRKETYERVKKEYESFGLTAQEAADVLTRVFASAGVTITPEPIGDSSDGINPCGYDELTPYLLGKEDFIRDEDG